MSKDTNSTERQVRRSFSDDFNQDAVNLVVVEGYSFNAPSMFGRAGVA